VERLVSQETKDHPGQPDQTEHQVPQERTVELDELDSPEESDFQESEDQLELEETMELMEPWDLTDPLEFQDWPVLPEEKDVWDGEVKPV